MYFCAIVIRQISKQNVSVPLIGHLLMARMIRLAGERPHPDGILICGFHPISLLRNAKAARNRDLIPANSGIDRPSTISILPNALFSGKCLARDIITGFLHAT